MLTMHLQMSATIVIVLAFLSGVIGCASGPRNDRYSQEWDMRKNELLSKVAAGDCRGIDALDRQSKGQCKMVMSEYEKERPSLVVLVCKKEKLTETECSRRLAETLRARYELTYPYAVWKDAIAQCNSMPTVCGYNSSYKITFEDQLALSNVDTITKLLNASREDIQNDANRNDRARGRALSDSLSHIGDGLIKTTQPQTCRSVPDGTGGFTTRCN